MIAQWENKVMSSMLLFLDNQICDKGQAYTNVTDQQAYLIDSNYNQLTWSATNYELQAWALPFKQIIIDESITGATICKTVELSQDGVNYSITSPQGAHMGDFNCILHHKGQFLFSDDITASGLTHAKANCAVKDFNIYISSKFEEDLLINTKYQTHPKINQTLAVLPDTKEVNTFNLEAEALRQGESVTIRQIISNKENFKSDLKYFDWFLLKSGDQGVMTNEAKILLNNYLYFVF